MRRAYVTVGDSARHPDVSLSFLAAPKAQRSESRDSATPRRNDRDFYVCHLPSAQSQRAPSAVEAKPQEGDPC